MEADKTPPAQAEGQGQAPELKTDPAQEATTQSQADSAEDGKPTVEEHPDLKRARAEAAKYRTQLRKYEQEAEERKQAEMTEAEKVAERARQLEEREKAFTQQQREFAARTSVIEEARKAGFKVSPERVFALVRDGIAFDDDGKPTNAAAVVAQLASDEPGLIGAVNGSATNPDRQKGSGLTAAQIAGMSDAELEKAGISTADMFRIAAKG